MPDGPRVTHLALVLALASVLYFLDLGGLGLTDRDEGSNAEAAREMVETGDWISPTLNYEPRFQKPPLLYWLIGGAYQTLGVSEFTARLPSAVFGVLLIGVQYLVLARLLGARVGLLGALMLLLNIEMPAIGRLVLTDSVLIFFTTLALYGFWLGHSGEGRKRQYVWLFYVGMALGTLTKGPIGFAVPLLAVVPFLTLTRQWFTFWHRGYPLAGMAVFLLLAAPWYAIMLWIHGAAYVQSARADTIGRFFTVIGGHGGTILFYFPVLFLGFFPWSGFLPAALAGVWRRWRTAFQLGPGDCPPSARGLSPAEGQVPASPEPVPATCLTPHASRDLELFAAIWLVAGFVFFSLSATRLPHYIGPLYPAAAILASTYWHRCMNGPATPGLRTSIRTIMGLGYLLGLGLAAGPALYSAFLDHIAKEFPMAPQISPGWGPSVAGTVIIVGVGLVWYFGRSESRRPGAFWVGTATIAAPLLIAVLITLPRFSHYLIEPPQRLAEAAGLNLGSDDQLILFGVNRPSLIFYARRPVILIDPQDPEKLIPHLGTDGRTMILLPGRLRSQLPAAAAEYPVILQRHGYLLLANRPMIDLPPAAQTPAPVPFHARPR